MPLLAEWLIAAGILLHVGMQSCPHLAWLDKRRRSSGRWFVTRAQVERPALFQKVNMWESIPVARLWRQRAVTVTEATSYLR